MQHPAQLLGSGGFNFSSSNDSYSRQPCNFTGSKRKFIMREAFPVVSEAASDIRGTAIRQHTTSLPPAHIQFLHRSEKTLRKLTLISIALLFAVTVSDAFGQGFDAAFGFGTVSSSAASTGACPVIGGTCTFPSLKGGLYPGFSADLILHRHLGVEGEINWKASQGLYGLQPYRPIFWNINAIYASRFTKNVGAELIGGIGAVDTRFYGTINYSPFAGYTNYTSSNHFDADVGGGIRAYFWHDAFIRPEVRVYFIHNNVEFSSGTVVRYGASIGYSFGGR